MANFAPLDPTALLEGSLAGRRGLTDADNPYRVGTREAIAWVIGLMYGRARRLQGGDRRAAQLNSEFQVHKSRKSDRRRPMV